MDDGYITSSPFVTEYVKSKPPPIPGTLDEDANACVLWMGRIAVVVAMPLLMMNCLRDF